MTTSSLNCGLFPSGTARPHRSSGMRNSEERRLARPLPSPPRIAQSYKRLRQSYVGLHCIGLLDELTEESTISSGGMLDLIARSHGRSPRRSRYREQGANDVIGGLGVVSIEVRCYARCCHSVPRFPFQDIVTLRRKHLHYTIYGRFLTVAKFRNSAVRSAFLPILLFF